MGRGAVLAALLRILTVAPAPAAELRLEMVSARRWTVDAAGEHRVAAALTLDGRVQRVLFEPETRRLALVPTDGERVHLPPGLTIVFFRDGSGLLQHATDAQSGETEVRWLAGFQRWRQEVRAFGLEPHLAVAPDGTSFFAGSGMPPVHSALARLERGPGDATRLLVAYSPDGQALWRRRIDAARAVVDLTVVSGGPAFVAVTADRENLLASHRIEVFSRDGRAAEPIPSDSTIQRIAPTIDHAFLFVQTQDGHALYSLDPETPRSAPPATPRARWRREQRLCLGSAGGAGVDPGERFLFLIERDCGAARDRRWRLSVLELSSGAILGRDPLASRPERPGTSLDSEAPRPGPADWIRVGGERVTAAVGDYVFEWAWSATP